MNTSPKALKYTGQVVLSEKAWEHRRQRREFMQFHWSLLWIASLLNVVPYRNVLQNTSSDNTFSVCAFVPFAYLCFWGIITLPLMWGAGEGLEEWWEWKRWRCLYYCNSGEKSTTKEVGMKLKIIYRQSMLMSSAKCWISVDFSGFPSLVKTVP